MWLATLCHVTGMARIVMAAPCPWAKVRSPTPRVRHSVTELHFGETALSRTLTLA